jgi:NitT/TauT family transport system substrate-binding protein
MPKIRAAGTFADTFAEGFFAVALDSFKKAGLDVEVAQFPNSPPQMTALLGGSLDIGTSDTVSLGTAIAKGAPFVLVAGGGLYNSQAPVTALCVPIASPIKTATDLIDKTIAVLGLHDLTEISTWAWLERNGVRSNQVKFTEIPLPQVPAALDRGTVDAGILAEPFLSQNKDKTVRVLGYVFDAIAPEFLISNWFTSKSFVAQNPTLVKRFVDVIYDTARWANTHHDESAPMLANVAKIPPSTVQRMTRSSFATSLDPRYIDPVFAAMYKYQVIDHKLTTADVVVRNG